MIIDGSHKSGPIAQLASTSISVFRNGCVLLAKVLFSMLERRLPDELNDLAIQDELGRFNRERTESLSLWSPCY
jgi:hypothetical protein